MLKNIMILFGAAASILLGAVVFKVSGLYDACESNTLKHLLGFSVSTIYLICFINGLRRSDELIQTKETVTELTPEFVPTED
jgi:hypothetical protein